MNELSIKNSFLAIKAQSNKAHQALISDIQSFMQPGNFVF